MKKFIIKMMMSTYKGAQQYFEEAEECHDVEIKRVLKDLAIGETTEFDKLYQIYKHKFDNPADPDCWLEYFTEEVHELRKKISEAL